MRKRITPKQVAESACVSRATIRRWADCAKLPCSRDWWGTRVFNEQAIDIAKKLAGTADLK